MLTEISMCETTHSVSVLECYCRFNKQYTAVCYAHMLIASIWVDCMSCIHVLCYAVCDAVDAVADAVCSMWAAQHEFGTFPHAAILS